MWVEHRFIADEPRGFTVCPGDVETVVKPDRFVFRTDLAAYLTHRAGNFTDGLWWIVRPSCRQRQRVARPCVGVCYLNLCLVPVRDDPYRSVVAVGDEEVAERVYGQSGWSIESCRRRIAVRKSTPITGQSFDQRE